MDRPACQLVRKVAIVLHSGNQLAKLVLTGVALYPPSPLFRRISPWAITGLSSLSGAMVCFWCTWQLSACGTSLCYFSGSLAGMVSISISQTMGGLLLLPGCRRCDLQRTQSGAPQFVPPPDTDPPPAHTPYSHLLLTPYPHTSYPHLILTPHTHPIPPHPLPRATGSLSFPLSVLSLPIGFVICPSRRLRL